MTTPALSIAWTTTGSEQEASTLAQGLIENKLAACIHIEGPITACYRWEGKVHQDSEYRLMIKFLSSKAKLIETWIHQHHPYDTPQWIVVQADAVNKAYLDWAK